MHRRIIIITLLVLTLAAGREEVFSAGSAPAWSRPRPRPRPAPRPGQPQAEDGAELPPALLAQAAADGRGAASLSAANGTGQEGGHIQR